jgi:hypothetical protein
MKSFKIKQPKTVGDVYSQSLDSMYNLGKYAYRGSMRLFGTMKSQEKQKRFVTMPKKKKSKK